MNIYNQRIFVCIGLSLLLAACGGSGGDDDDDDTTTYRYTVTSTSFFIGGEQVAVVRFGLSGSCASPTGITSSIRRVGAGTVVTPGTVSFKFKTKITPPMMESVYIDTNASGNLDAGDLVWGDDPSDLIGACFDNFSANQNFDWEDVGAQIQAALGLSQPWITYTGAPQAFRGEQNSESVLKTQQAIIDKAVAVEGDGYHSLRW